MEVGMIFMRICSGNGMCFINNFFTSFLSKSC